MLTRLLRPYSGRLLAACAMFALKDSPLWLIPLLTGTVIDLVVAGGPLGRLWLCAGLAVLLLGQNYPTGVAFSVWSSQTYRQVAAELRNALAARLQALSVGYHTRAGSVVQTKVVRDVENIELLLQQALPPALSSVLVLAGAMTMTALTVPVFVGVFALVVPLSALLVVGVRGRSRRDNEAFRREVERLSAQVGEMAALLPITRAHGLEATAQERVARSAERVRDAGLRLDRLNGMFGALSWVSYQLLGMACLLLAAAASISGVLPVSAGEVVQLSAYFTIMTGGIVTLTGLVPIFARGLESLRSVGEVLAEPDLEQNQGKRAVDAVRGHIRFADVTFRYPGADAPAVDGLTLDIAAGETVAFVGSSGSGKSTVLNLVLGFVRPTSGRILLDGRDCEELDLRTARRFVSVVPQESVLFEGSLRDNVTYGLTDVDDDRVRAALAGANALDLLAALPQGWDTVVGERGARLSGGQRQRIAIARALVRDPRMLLLDEATSALDGESEAAVRDALAALMRGRTTLVVAHRLSTIRAADRIVVLEAGRVVEVGGYAELLDRGGRFAALAARV